MKFLTKINRNLFLQLTIILFFVSIGGYFILHAIIFEDAKESLLEKEFLIQKQLSETGEVPNLYPIIEVNEISRRKIQEAIFKEILIKNELEDEWEVYIEYSNEIEVDGRYYSVKMRQLTFETEDLILGLSLSLFFLLLIVFTISGFITQRLNKTVWKAFEQNLHAIENFNFKESLPLALQKTDIDEFDRLSAVLDILTEKLTTDYNVLKEFTENASHEIQTPIAIVLLNLEEILQKDIDEEVFKKVVASINALKRLSSLNQSLILLAKIDNRQYVGNKELNISELIKRKLIEFSPLIDARKITVHLEEKNPFIAKLHNHLAEILINNLISNAVNHNFNGGEIQISINEKHIKICNTGEAGNLTQETIFDRFSKADSKSFGLGLAIVKKICDNNKLNIQYYKDEKHCFEIK